jgi:hypothetical protein
MMEVMRVANEIERLEEEALLKKAMEASENSQNEVRDLEKEEEEMMQKVMAQSLKEEEDRIKKLANEKTKIIEEKKEVLTTNNQI